MPFKMDPNTGIGYYYENDRTYNPGQVTGAPYSAGPSNDRIVRDQFYGAPAPANGSPDPNAPQGQGMALDLDMGGFQIPSGPTQQLGSTGAGYYGAPYGGPSYYGAPAAQQNTADPFGDIGRSMQEMLVAMQQSLDEQRRAWLEESNKRMAELSELEEAKKKRLLLGAKGRAGNILSAGSGITAQGAPVSRAVLY